MPGTRGGQGGYNNRGGNGGYRGGNQNRGGGGQKKGNGERVGVLTGWINAGDDSAQATIVADMQGVNFRLVPQEGVEIYVDGKLFEGDLRLFRNDHDKGAGPHVNVVGYSS